MNDHGFRRACPSGNHMLEDKLWISKRRRLVMKNCSECGEWDSLKLINTLDRGWKEVCENCYWDLSEERRGE